MVCAEFNMCLILNDLSILVISKFYFASYNEIILTFNKMRI
ncbi:hypothetical protein GARC_1999 [Paraglaciecola arctica BSs20135]|uniref:Uncharacterized protein n=1 Tax=Paraglaciecola arctica BSs20135 TaxID=493475 RepID=K6Y4T7_9ALTE|nr:hypothetical protein GARC_1999 [Paraglaciecola arctica BSs20135]